MLIMSLVPDLLNTGWVLYTQGYGMTPKDV